MKEKWLLFVFVAAFLLSGATAYAYDANVASYRDLNRGDWSEEAVYTLSVLGIISGYEDGSFRPGAEITREAFVKMLVSSLRQELPAAGQAETGQLPYADVSPQSWSYPYLIMAERLGLVGFLAEDGRLEPGRALLREEVAALAGRYLLVSDPALASGTDLPALAEEEKGRRAFLDADEVDPALAPYLYAAVSRGIMEGDDTGRFQPKATLARKEAAAILFRLISQEVQDEPLEQTGFYAIRSYGSREHMKDLDRIVFGWANLDYSGEAGASLNTTSTEYKIPEAAGEALELADASGAFKEIMVYADGGELTGFLEDEAVWAVFLQELQAYASEGGYDGVCLDFEGLLLERHREPYSRFAELARQTLTGLELTIAVPPATYYAGYDLARLGQAADRIILMAYDFTHRESRLPSAPLPHVEEALVNLLSYIPREKAVLGISKQANQWSDSLADGSASYYSPAIELVEARLARPETAVSLEFPYFLKRLSYEDGSTASEIWYEDEESIAKKLWLARYYGLKGVSYWHMGNLTERDWELIRRQ